MTNKTKKRVLWEVVCKEAKKTRHVKSSSYNLMDPYEVDLLNYAEDEDKHGTYSEFIKRLIAEHKFRAENPQYLSPAVSNTNTITEKKEVNTASMSGFL